MMDLVFVIQNLNVHPYLEYHSLSVYVKTDILPFWCYLGVEKILKRCTLSTLTHTSMSRHYLVMNCAVSFSQITHLLFQGVQNSSFSSPPFYEALIDILNFIIWHILKFRLNLERKMIIESNKTSFDAFLQDGFTTSNTYVRFKDENASEQLKFKYKVIFGYGS